MKRSLVFLSIFCIAQAIRLEPGSFDLSPYARDRDAYLLFINNETKTKAFDGEPDTWIEDLVVDTQARVFLIHNLLTSDECDLIIKRADPLLQRSTVVDGAGGGKVDTIRNSAGTFLNRRSDPVISRLNDRLSHVTRMPVSHQVLPGPGFCCFQGIC